MNSFLLIHLLAILTLTINNFVHSKKSSVEASNRTRILANVKIYSNLAEIIQPLGKLPLEFSDEDWTDIRPDSVTLVGSNVNVTQQTVTEKKKSLNNAHVYVRSPSSSNTKPKYVKATIIDEKRNLVKLIDKDIGKEPVFLTVSPDHIAHVEEPSQSKYYVNFTYDTTDAVYVSYLRSQLNWKTRYQLNLFEESKRSVLIAMADIRNEGQSKIDIEHAELLGGDINLQTSQPSPSPEYDADMMGDASVSFKFRPSVGRGEEVAGLYVFAINQPFSIDAKTNYLLPMFRPQVTVERYGSIKKHFGGSVGNSNGKAQRSYRLSSDHFLSRGNCIIRESDRLVGETSLPDLAAKDKHEFSIGQDADIVYKENVTLVSTVTYNETVRLNSQKAQEKTKSVYNINVLLKNFKKNRPVKVEYEQRVYGQSVKLAAPNAVFTQDGSTVKAALTIPADNEKLVSYKVEIIQ